MAYSKKAIKLLKKIQTKAKSAGEIAKSRDNLQLEMAANSAFYEPIIYDFYNQRLLKVISKLELVENKIHALTKELKPHAPDVAANLEKARDELNEKMATSEANFYQNADNLKRKALNQHTAFTSAFSKLLLSSYFDRMAPSMLNALNEIQSMPDSMEAELELYEMKLDKNKVANTALKRNYISRVQKYSEQHLLMDISTLFHRAKLIYPNLDDDLNLLDKNVHLKSIISDIILLKIAISDLNLVTMMIDDDKNIVLISNTISQLQDVAVNAVSRYELPKKLSINNSDDYTILRLQKVLEEINNEANTEFVLSVWDKVNLRELIKRNKALSRYLFKSGRVGNEDKLKSYLDNNSQKHEILKMDDGYIMQRFLPIFESTLNMVSSIDIKAELNKILNAET